MTTNWDDRIAEHLKVMLKQMKTQGRFAIGETDPPNNSTRWYRPNAYHTYWAIESLEALQKRFPDKYLELDKALGFEAKIAQMRHWARETLGYQVALHSGNSSLLDSDQLVWALATCIRHPESFRSHSAEQDFIRQSLKCLFTTQRKNGSFERYAPLFHYRNTGNAYCYFFEGFAALLKHVLAPNADFLRELLKSDCENLMRMWEYAIATQVTVDGPTRIAIWSSGHRTNNEYPESWATASVFSFAQSLRRLFGIWTRDEALECLPKRTLHDSPSAALDTLRKRTRTWTLGNQLSSELEILFVNPLLSGGPFDVLEPDNQPVNENSARSAIFYGPPGTSKTTIARSIAGAVGWDYVEIHASHFVADGLPNVQRKADEIFNALMELDHAIVLFDEIDELVRERENEADAFGRFLTTSMLPKLAELWKSRKVMYFIASNHIGYFDRAITRSERFDAVIFVSPPSFESKKTELLRLFEERFGYTSKFVVTKDEIDRAMPEFKDCDKPGELVAPLPMANALAKFILLRWDELAELAEHFGDIRSDDAIDSARLAEALRKVKDGQWRTLREYYEYSQGPTYERRDFSKTRMWDVRKS